jgi:hypothetical protein
MSLSICALCAPSEDLLLSTDGMGGEKRKKSFLPPWSVGLVQVSSLESKTGYLASSDSQNQERDLPDPNPPRFYITWHHVTMSTCPRPAYVSPVPPVRRRGQINQAASTSRIPHFSQTLAEIGSGRRASYRRRPAGVVQAVAVDARTQCRAQIQGSRSGTQVRRTPSTRQ